MTREGFKLAGDVKDVCAELEREAQRCKGMTVGTWLRLRRIEQAVANQLEMPVEKYRQIGSRCDED